MKWLNLSGGLILSLTSLWGGSYFMAPKWFAFPLYITCSLAFVAGLMIIIKEVDK